MNINQNNNKIFKKWHKSFIIRGFFLKYSLLNLSVHVEYSENAVYKLLLHLYTCAQLERYEQC